ncbi:Hypothetical predicted protein [Pelobates cultripes]|uniref:Uncharacterized protein n=1 Tax=Pelobates cultripes TaxID=61616 RepID=A0AAD1WDW2_PELCU|nr:Hypothetical predicted protein [Pelobates cultripes]
MNGEASGRMMEGLKHKQHIPTLLTYLVRKPPNKPPSLTHPPGQSALCLRAQLAVTIPQRVLLIRQRPQKLEGGGEQAYYRAEGDKP